MCAEISPPTPDEPASEAIPKLLELYGDKIHALGLRLCGGPDKAEDIVQETFFSAYKHWDQFEGRSEPSTWLFTIATRACRRMHRRRAGQPAHVESLEELLPVGGEAVPDVSSLGESPADHLMRQEAEAIVQQAIGELPMRFRLPLVLKDIAEFKISEIAEILGFKEATIKTRIHRARLFLRNALAENLPKKAPEGDEHTRQMCLDLLHSKQEALDRGVEFPMVVRELCSRCETVFATLDMLRDTCTCLGEGKLPEQVREQLLERFTDEIR